MHILQSSPPWMQADCRHVGAHSAASRHLHLVQDCLLYPADVPQLRGQLSSAVKVTRTKGAYQILIHSEEGGVPRVRGQWQCQGRLASAEQLAQ